MKNLIGVIVALTLVSTCHNHHKEPLRFANGHKGTLITVCGDTQQVLNSGRHIELSRWKMEALGIKRPE